MNLNGMQVIVVSQPGLPNEQPTYRSMKPRLAKQLIGLGVVHILNGVFCIIFQSISLEKFLNNRDYPYGGLVVFGHGFWSGLLFLVTGIMGITAGTRKGNCQVVAFNILSTISAAIASILIIVAAISVFISFYERKLDWRYDRNHTNYVKLTTILVMESMLVAMGVLEGIIAIWSCIVCCLIGVCNCCLASPPQTQPMILSAEQQAALMSNPMFMANQQQQMVQYNKEQSNVPPYFQQSYTHNNFMSAAIVEGSYTGLNSGTRRNLPYSNMDESAGITTSTYEELPEYEEIEEALSSSFVNAEN